MLSICNLGKVMRFYLAALPVGFFLEYPTKPGRYEYSPFRGEGHAEFSQALKRARTVVCSFTRGWKTVRLLITAEEYIESRWYVQISQLWVRPRALVLLLVWLGIGMVLLLFSQM